MAYNVYSLPDCKSVLYHPDVGTANLHQCGMGKIVVSAAGVSRGTTRISGSLSCGAREIRSPCAWRGGARPGSRVTGGD